MIRSPIRSWPILASVGIPALLLVAACGGQANVGAGSFDEMEDRMFGADWALEHTAESLLDIGYEFGRLTARFEACDERLYRFVYGTSLYAPSETTFTVAEIDALGAELAAAGWETVDPAPPDSRVGTPGWPITMSQREFGEISLVVDAADDDAAAASLTIATECVAATDREIELFESMGEWEPVRRLPVQSAPPTTG
jgi:hypothetical protein